MSAIFIQTYKSPVGDLIIGDFDSQLCILDWKYRRRRNLVDDRIRQAFNAGFIEEETVLHRQVVSQLNDYFSKRRTSFDIPITLVGTDFQKKIWQLLLKISYGETISYLELSRQYGDEKAIRAVASANGANAISIIIPCHRVIGKRGELTGYAGGLDAKKKLLEIEGMYQPPLTLF